VSAADVGQTQGVVPGAFDKYGLSGAYHWTKLQGRGVRFYHARLQARYNWFIRWVAELMPSDVLDVGSGDAALTHLLAETVTGVVVGVEPDEDGLALAKTALGRISSRATVTRGAAQCLPFGDASVDVVVMCEVIEHLTDVDGALAEAARVLRHGGTLLLSTPRRNLLLTDERHVREFDASELRIACRRHFHSVDVFVAEPRPLQRLYATRPGRWLLNALAGVRLNVFERTLRAEPVFVRFGQLYAVASGPVGGA
jgi:SAM-dependent methyltransferase